MKYVIKYQFLGRVPHVRWNVDRDRASYIREEATEYNKCQLDEAVCNGEADCPVAYLEDGSKSKQAYTREFVPADE